MPLTVSDDILCEIGRVAVYQSHIEGQMSLFIHDLSYLDEGKGNIITFRLSFWELIRMVGSLMLNEFGAENKYVKRFEEFRKAMNELVPQRNNFIHSMWGFGTTLKSDSGTRVKVVKDKPKGAILESVPVTLKELKDISKEMEHLEWEISDIRVRVCHYEASARASRP